MLKVRRITIWLLVIGLLIGGCQGNTSALSAAPGITATPTPAEAGNYWELVKEAQNAYASANFNSAMDLARQAIDSNPQDNTAWEIYNQAAIAQAGDSYLSELPDQRYQLPISMDIFRGRYRTGYDKPEPLAPSKPLSYRFDLPAANHVFLPGHRIMVHVQSSWFPLYDRNPQKYVPNIFFARPGDYIKATQRIFHTPKDASYIELPVVSGVSQKQLN